VRFVHFSIVWRKQYQALADLYYHHRDLKGTSIDAIELFTERLHRFRALLLITKIVGKREQGRGLTATHRPAHLKNKYSDAAEHFAEKLHQLI
jgi:hypothetical protein